MHIKTAKIQCNVCQRKGSAMHYGAVTCEGCKAFFRRMMDKRVTYICPLNKSCTINRTVNRVCCRACRFQKCLKIGMKMFGPRLQKTSNKTEIRQVTDSSMQTDDDFIANPTCVCMHVVKSETRNVPSPCRSVSDDICLLDSPMIIASMIPYDDQLTDSQRRKLTTIDAVIKAVNFIFAEQLSQWKTFMDITLMTDERPHQPQTDLDTMAQAVHWHNRQVGRKAVKFLTMLPGIEELHLTEPRSLVGGWKWLAFWIIYQSPFLHSGDTFLTIDMHGQPLHYCRYWQDQMTYPRLTDLTFRFAVGLNQMHLTQLETFLLTAVILFEPESDQGSAETKGDPALQTLHRYYTDVLVDVLKHRCSGQAELSHICAELGQFFGEFKRIYQLYTNYVCCTFKALVHRNVPM